MRSTLFAVGALLFAAYPLVLLFAVAGKIDEPRENPDTAAITLSSGSANQAFRNDGTQSTYRTLRNTTLRRSAQ
jgi:hypothetical protein